MHRRQTTSRTVSARTNPAGAIRARWAWTAPEVWTERMLMALEEGVRGGRWHTLIDKVYAERTLRAAFARVKANRGAPGVDHVTVAMFETATRRESRRAGAALRDGTYRPQPIRRHWIPKGPRARRPLGIPTVRDRVVQTALRLVLEPIFEVTFAPHSYGFRPQRSAKDALRRVAALLRAGYGYVVDADLQSYFDTIPHVPLQARVAVEGQRQAGARARRRVSAPADLRRAGAVDASTTGPRKARSSVPYSPICISTRSTTRWPRGL